MAHTLEIPENTRMATRSKSSSPVSLRNLVDCLDMLPEQAAAFLDVQTGEILELTEELRNLLDDNDDLEDCSDWEREAVEQVRTLSEEDRLLDLPSRFDLDDYDIMSRFAYSWEPQAQSDQLLRAIAGKGAFRNFRATIQRLGIENAWYRFRERALADFAIDFLNGNGIPYKDDLAEGREG